MVDGPRNAAGARGFTLLELLIAITILSLILVTLTGGVRFASQAWETQSARSARQGDIDAVQNVLRQIISSGQSFTGTEGRLEFVGAMPAALARGGLYDIELSAVSDRLTVVWRPHFKGTGALPPPAEADLVRQLASFNIVYYVGGSWRAFLPADAVDLALIRIQATFPDGRTWPPLVIAPMVAAKAKDTESDTENDTK